MDDLLDRARTLHVTRIVVIPIELVNEFTVPQKCPALVLVRNTSDEARQLLPNGVSSTRSTVEPEELQPALYLGFTGYGAINFGRANERGSFVRLNPRSGISRLHFGITLSSFGTWLVRNYASQCIWVNALPTASQTCTALIPEHGRLNSILVNHYSFGCVIVYDTPLSLHNINENLALPGLEEANRSAISVKATASRRTSSSDRTTSVASSFLDVAALWRPETAYIILDFLGALSWSARTFHAIKATAQDANDDRVGGRYLAHRFDHQQHALLTSFFFRNERELKHPHIATLADLEVDTHTILQEYHGHQSVEHADVWEACAVFRQLTLALAYTHSKSISHGDVSRRFIIRSATRAYNVQLDGFWYSKVVNMNDAFEPENDLLGLAASVRELLNQQLQISEMSESQLMDPLLESMLVRAESSSASAEDLAAELSKRSFKDDTAFVQNISIPWDASIRFVSGRNTEGNPAYHTGDLFDVYERLTRSNWRRGPSTQAIRHKIQEQSTGSYIGRKMFEKIMQHAHVMPFGFHLPRRLNTSSGTLDVCLIAQIQCIPTCGMLNLSEFLGTVRINPDILSDEDVLNNEMLYEIRSADDRSDLYILKDAFEALIARVGQRDGYDMSSISEHISEQRLHMIRCFTMQEYIIFATSLPWTNAVVVARKGLRAKWIAWSTEDSDPWISLNESLARCDTFGLSALKQQLQDFKSLHSHAPKAWLTYLTDPSSSSYVTTLGGADFETDSDDEIKFRRKRRGRK